MRKLTRATLVKAGFHKVGHWHLSNDGMVLDGEPAKEAGVYAFWVDGDVRYVGSAQRGLKRRFRTYAKTKTLRTSSRIRGEIINCLNKNCDVEIYAYCPPEFLRWNSLPVDLVAGIEEGLIRTFRPAWNKRSNTDR